MTSPLVARVLEQLRDELVEQDLRVLGSDVQANWDEYLAIDRSRDEWSLVVDFVRVEWRTAWAGWDTRTRHQNATDLASPFVLTEQTLAELVHDIEIAVSSQAAPGESER